MTQVTFFLLDGQPSETAETLSAACELAARCFRARQRCTVHCDSQQRAEEFDELLWQQPTDSFVPHNLSGEGPAGGAPVEISWQTPVQINRPVLINLGRQIPAFVQHFKQIYDFVPTSDEAKQQARERYKHYRAAGYPLDTLPASSINESQDG